MRRLPALVVAVVLVVAGCGGDDDEPDTTGTVRGEAVTSPTGDDTTTTGGSGPAGSGTTSPPRTEPAPQEVRLAEVTRLGSLSALAPHPETGDLFVAGRAGEVWVVDPASGEATAPVLDIGDRTVAEGERGLLGIAIAPDARHLYLYFTGTAGDSVLDEYPLDGRRVDAGGRRQLLTLDQPFPNHNGGQLAFGPDGHLYLGLGDGGSAGDPLGAGQDTGNLLGKILRIDPGGGDPYAVPADNPFVDGGGAPEVWLHGVRNPWRFSFDRDTGDLWVADVGQNQWEEVDRLPTGDDGTAGRGANLGWNEMEGDQPFGGGSPPPNHTPPIYTYGRGDGCSITGGYVYRGEALASLDGVYLFGDYCTSQLWGLRLDHDGRVVERLDLGLNVGASQLVSFGEDLDGEIYALTDGGTLYRLEPAG